MKNLSVLAWVLQTATPTETPEDGEESGWIEELQQLVEVIREFNQGWTDDLNTALEDALEGPFQALANVIVDILTYLFTDFPSLTAPDLVRFHAEVFQLALLLSGAAIVWIGFLHVSNRIHGVRPLVYLLAALAVGGVAPWLLDYLVQLSQSLTVALKPVNPEPNSVIRTTSGLLVITILNAFLLLGIAVVFAVRDVFFMFTAVTAPFLGLMLVFPYTQRYASSLLGAFAGFLLIGPLDMIVFRLILIFLEVPAGETPQWVWATGGFTLMLGIPYIVLTSGLAAVGPGQSLIQGANIPRKQALKNRIQPQKRSEDVSGFDRRRGRGNRFQGRDW